MRSVESPEGGLRPLARDAMIYGAGDFLPRAVNFLLLPIMTRYLGPQDYGILALVQVVAAAAEILFCLGADSAFARFYPGLKSPEERRRLFRSVNVQLLLQGIFGGLAFALFLPQFLRWYSGEEIGGRIVYALGGVTLAFLYLVSALPLLQARLDGRPRFYLAFRLSSFAVSTAAILYFVVVRREGALGSIKGQIIGAGVTAIALLWIFRRVLIEPGFDRSAIVQSWKFGFPLFGGQASSWFFTFSDRVFLQRFRTLDTVGVYQMASNFALPLDLAINALNFAWMPHFYRQALERKDFESLTRDALRLICAVCVGLTAYLALVRPLIALMTAPAFHVAYRIADLLVIYYGSRMVWCVASNALSVRDQTGTMARITWGTGAVQLAANLALIPGMGALGAAASTVMAGGVRAAWSLRAMRAVWPAHLSGRSLLHIATGFGLTAGGILAIDFLSISPWVTWALPAKISLVAAFYGLMRRKELMFPLGALLTLFRRSTTPEAESKV